ncbi:hypothetical protein HNO88_004497 [Novosphingobium chloroacetimidivorans]|uniref:Uncharacterized protein n=1 Tax=Novosphingobium chloroacetimidivorans TaxID=1428314 RepID=A0A7W7NXY3_9SPHN|nr:hypothetical protein [Novosphingobium chloroacetimidivorans]MBB4861143.1 hypothetical protein [Novosphingobium chloroacetimidivorans]
MAIDWQQLPERGSMLPFNGDQVLLAVPNLIGTSFGGDGKKVDADFPFSLHLARWIDERLEWTTNETDEDTGGSLWLNPTVPVFWGEVEMPY